MTGRAAIASRAAEGLRAFENRISENRTLIGMDGFVDSIIQVVDKRHAVDRYEPMSTIEQFGLRVQAAAGQSANFELVTQRQKLGGNGPIMANALASIGLPVTYVGAVGLPEIHSVFREFAARADVLSISEPGFTDALEFNDGKLMLGKHETLRDVNIDQVDRVLGAERFEQLVAESRLVGMLNWTMLPAMREIWMRLIDDVLPALSERKWIFIDLADPEKRTLADKREALTQLEAMQRHADVMLGLNLAEARQMCHVLEIDADDIEARLAETAEAVRAALGLHGVVVHPRSGAAAAVEIDGTVSTGAFQGPFVKKAKITTGAGDHFNAGFCLGLLAELDVEAALCVGTATSGYYVRHAESPSLGQLADFCAHLPAPEA